MANAILSLVVDSSKMLPQLRQASVALDNFGMKALKAGAYLSALSIPLGYISKQAIDAASDAEETASKFSVVFNSVADEATAAASSISENFGLASSTTKKLLSDTGDLLSGFGFTGKEALDMSMQVNNLAVDLASFTNIEGGAERASAALTKALLGERESVKSLGIAILDADIESLAKEKGIIGNLSRQQKAMLTLELAIRQSKNAIGDYARTSDSYANTVKRMQQRMLSLQESYGKLLIDGLKLDKVFGFITDQVMSFNKWMDSLNPKIKSFIAYIAGAGIIAAPLVTAVAGISFVVSSLLPVLAALTPTVGIVAVAIGAFVATVVDNFGMVSDAILSAYEIISPSFISMGSALSDIASLVQDYVSPILGGILVLAISSLTQSILGIKIAFNIVSIGVKSAVLLIVSSIELMAKPLILLGKQFEKTRGFAEQLEAGFEGMRQGLTEGIKEDVNDIGDAFVGMGKNAINTAKILTGNFRNSANSAADAASKIAESGATTAPSSSIMPQGQGASKFASLATMGSVEAYKAEIAKVNFDELISKSSQETAENTKGILDQVRRSNPSYDLGI